MQRHARGRRRRGAMGAMMRIAILQVGKGKIRGEGGSTLLLLLCCVL